MKYIVIDDATTMSAVCDEYEYNDLESAKKKADSIFQHLTESEVKKRDGLYVLESVNPDENAEDHHDGDPVYTLI